MAVRTSFEWSFFSRSRRTSHEEIDENRGASSRSAARSRPDLEDAPVFSSISPRGTSRDLELHQTVRKLHFTSLPPLFGFVHLWETIALF